MPKKITLQKMQRPILMSPMMVGAILQGLKHMTRRTIKGMLDEPDAYSFTRIVIDPEVCDEDDDNDIRPKVLEGTCAEFSKGELVVKCPFGNVGDTLWVKERTWWEKGKDFTNVAFFDGTLVTIKAGKPNKTMKIPNWKPTDKKIWKGKPSMFMPKNVCRLRLKITNIRVERLHDITEKDAIREGIEPHDGGFRSYEIIHTGKHKGQPNPHAKFPNKRAKDSFMELWESINGKDSWKENPFVWIVEFKRIESNKK